MGICACGRIFTPKSCLIAYKIVVGQYHVNRIRGLSRHQTRNKLSIRIKFFASLAESLNRREEAVDYREGMTVASLWTQITEDGLVPSGVLSAVNMEYCEPDQTLRDGDEVAYFPPITGGAGAD